MDHPYSGAASYIYANEHRDAPVESRFSHPYSRVASAASSPTAPTSITPTYVTRTSNDSSWSTEGTYTRTKRPKHDSPEPPTSAARPAAQPRLLMPLRGPVSRPPQQQRARRATAARTHDRDRDVDALARVPQRRASPAPVRASASTATTSARARPPTWAPSFKMTPYERDGDPLSLRHSAFMPSEAPPRASRRVQIQVRVPFARRPRAPGVVSDIYSGHCTTEEHSAHYPAAQRDDMASPRFILVPFLLTFAVSAAAGENSLRLGKPASAYLAS
ncbi:hypothetical protein GGX14DRAFT_700750 [Mycena pura]|uniref:Uncharacterized protein n=1 Tax=Mycena pura TaxID=153505 RepID=A0AAD6Y0I6_9AGAR|nr:hypothetical protein GGX14DRAFT_700750 [Mycena pura]